MRRRQFQRVTCRTSSVSAVNEDLRYLCEMPLQTSASQSLSGVIEQRVAGRCLSSPAVASALSALPRASHATGSFGILAIRFGSTNGSRRGPAAVPYLMTSAHHQATQHSKCLSLRPMGKYQTPARLPRLPRKPTSHCRSLRRSLRNNTHASRRARALLTISFCSQLGEPGTHS